jgi:ABC-type multidrug transport system fused ATPase/permease subunit
MHSIKRFRIYLSGILKFLVELRKLIGHEKDMQMIWMLFLMVVVGVLDLLGVGAIYPLLSSVINASEVNNSWWIQIIYRNIGYVDLGALIVTMAILLLGMFLAKALLTSYANYYQYRFSYRFSSSLAHRVLKGYFSLDYSFFLSQNSAVLLKNVLGETNLVAVGVLIPLQSLISDSLIIIPLCILLIFVNPGTNLSAMLVVIALFGFSFLLMRSRLLVWGKEREALLAEANRIAHQSLFGVKEVKAINCEESYLVRLQKCLQHYANLTTYYASVQALPRIWIDFIVMSALALLILFAQKTDMNLAQLAPLLGLYVAAFYRILPLFNRTFTNITTIVYYQPSVFVLREAIQGIEDLERSIKLSRSLDYVVPSLRGSIEFERVTYQYPNAEKNSVYDLTLKIPAGSRTAFVGASGAGKTTTVDLLLGLLEPTLGTISVDGLHLVKSNSRSWRDQIGYVPQQIFLADASVEDNIALGTLEGNIDPLRLDAAIRMAGLERVIALLPQGIKTPLGENGVRLSGGERQRIGIARALYRQPRLLILDEATSALDMTTERQIMRDVFSLGRETTIIIISHRLSAVQPCDQLFFLKNSRLVASGTYDEIVQNVPDFAAMATEPKDDEN